MSTRILIAEDDVAIARALRDSFRTAGFTTNVVNDGTRVLGALQQNRYNLLLLDLMLPGLDGVEVCREIRHARMTIPILMLTARDSLRSRVEGLDAGADDYLTKPFEVPELMARVRALLRRHHVVKSTEIEIGDLYINFAQKVVRRAAREVVLTPKEFDLLATLAQDAGAVLSKEVLSERVWQEDYTSHNTVEVHMKNLRRKLEREDETKLIHTVHGMGYTLRADE